MLCTLVCMRRSRSSRAGIGWGIRWFRRVRLNGLFEPFQCSDSCIFLLLSAIAGAAATIASDALMNPFDGALSHKTDNFKLISRNFSCKATNANTWLRVSFCLQMCSLGIQERRDRSFLRVIPNYTHDNRSLHRGTIHRLRAREANSESAERILSIDTYSCGRTCRRCRCGCDNAFRRGKNALADPRNVERPGDPKRAWDCGCDEDHLHARWVERLRERVDASYAHTHAQ